MEQIIRTEYSVEMQKAYIDYAMSVIVARALPDVRDGLKPVQRRTLYDMHELGIRYDRPYRKSARIVGDTMGKYHPHGDSSIYEALVVMAQEFKKGLPLVDGHGNFGSIEGDGAAAMRYTEARLAKVTQKAYLADLDKDVVNFVPNFDETEKEPEVLPVRVPNLLINGSEGIAVGMATSMPPHNFGEVIDAAIAFVKDPSMDTRALMRYLPGPDFPTGGIVTNKDELAEIYETGVGKIRLRGKVEIEPVKGGRERVVITEIPYTMIGANIGKFLNDIYQLVEKKTTTDIVDIINESSKEGIRIVIELKKGADAQHIEQMLYKKTKLEDTFGVNMLAVANGRPETMGLVQILENYLDFQYDLLTRKYNTLLKKEMEKQEIQEGLIEACNCIDLIIEILRGSKNIADVRACLTKGVTDNIRFKSAASKKQAAKLSFSEKQANAILEMRLYRLIGLEIDALLKEHEETMKNIAEYLDILNSHESMNRVLIGELKGYKKEFARPRRTQIENAAAVVYEEEAPKELPVVFLMDRFGYAKTVDPSVFERNKDNAVAENKYIFEMLNTDRVCIFTNTGVMHTIKAMDLPYGKFRDKGTPIDNVSNYDSSKETLIYACPLAALSAGKVLFVAKSGLSKQVDGSEFVASKKTIAATKLADGDALMLVRTLHGGEHLVVQSEKGFFLRFPAEEIPEKKKTALGVRSINLSADDRLAGAYVLDDADIVISYKDTEMHLNRLKIGKRDNKGVKR